MAGSGKSHTVFGSAAQPGITQLAVDAFLKVAQAEGGANVSLSYMQLYGKDLSDLLAEGTERTKERLTMREVLGEVVVQGLSTHPVAELADLEELLALGHRRRAVACTLLNTASSRSHAVVTVYWEQGSTAGKLHLVDLAGSERVKKSGADGVSLKEAAAINTSLFHLARVTHALLERQQKPGKPVVVPYKDGPLCFLLKDTLGGPCSTALLATVSPAQAFASETQGTLNFVAGCSAISQAPQISGPRPWQQRSKGNAIAFARKVEAVAEAQASQKLPWARVKVGSARCRGGRVSLTLDGLKNHTALSALVYGPAAAASGADLPVRLAVLIHGCPSCAEDSFGHGCWNIIPALTVSGYTVAALDLPGCGCSPGPALRARSEFNLTPGGSADVVMAAIEALKKHLPLKGKDFMVGSDWGGGIALSMGTSRKHKHRIGEVIALLPSYSETEKVSLFSVRK